MTSINRGLVASLLLIGLHGAAAAEREQQGRVNANGAAEPNERQEAGASADDKSKQEEERYREMYPDEPLTPKTFEPPDRAIPSGQKIRP